METHYRNILVNRARKKSVGQRFKELVWRKYPDALLASLRAFGGWCDG